MNSVRAQVGGAGRAAGAGLVADRALDHLDVAVAPLLEALVEVDEALADLGRPAVVGVHGEQHVVELGMRVDRRRRRRGASAAAGTAKPWAAR